MDRAAAEEWIRAHVEPVGAVETAHERPWATVLRVPLADGVAWFKACAPVQAVEPRLTVQLFARWPDRVAEVLGHDEERAWLLLADAGTPIRERGNPPEPWLVALPLYAELQLGEAAHTHDHLAKRRSGYAGRNASGALRGSPAARTAARARRDPTADEFAPRFADLCGELAALDVPETAQHDDLHHANLRARGRLDTAA